MIETTGLPSSKFNYLSRSLTGIGYACLISLSFVVPSAADTPLPPKLTFPLNCEGQTCFPFSYIDHQPGDGLQDYSCGENTTEQASMTHIALRSLADIDRGVAVLAAASGVVRGMRDGVRDEGPEFRDAKGEPPPFCGNAVEILHENDWVTRYCHMREGSIVIKSGDKIEAGDVIGYAGWSGMAPLPGLGFRLSDGNTVIDPFTGKASTENCSAKGTSLWQNIPEGFSDYQNIIIVDAGFAGSPQPLLPDILRGYHRTRKLSRTSPSLMFWVLVGNVVTGEKRTLQIIGPDDRIIAEQNHTERDNQPLALLLTGAARPADGWKPGKYSASIVIARDINGRVMRINKFFDIEVE